jgi:hypothetical protein
MVLDSVLSMVLDSVLSMGLDLVLGMGLDPVLGILLGAWSRNCHSPQNYHSQNYYLKSSSED